MRVMISESAYPRPSQWFQHWGKPYRKITQRCKCIVAIWNLQGYFNKNRKKVIAGAPGLTQRNYGRIMQTSAAYQSLHTRRVRRVLYLVLYQWNRIRIPDRPRNVDCCNLVLLSFGVGALATLDVYTAVGALRGSRTVKFDSCNNLWWVICPCILCL